MTLPSSRPARPAGFTLETLPLPQPTRMADAWMLTVHSLKDCPKLDLCAHAPPRPPARPNAVHTHTMMSDPRRHHTAATASPLCPVD